jgi:hypothetical protein
MLLFLQKYNFEQHFCPGVQFIIADTLSRSYPPCTENVTSFTEDIASLSDADNEAREELRMMASGAHDQLH